MLGWIQAASAAVWLLALAPPDLGGQPVPDGGGEIDWLLTAPWAKVALLVTAAVGVLVMANLFARNRGQQRGTRARPDFDLRIAKLEALPPTPLAEAGAGAVHVEGVLEKGQGALGQGEFACVYHNRHGAGRATAIGAELVLLADGSGLLGLENLEQARVIAPREDDGPHDTISLYLGDRVQVLGELLLLDQAQDVGERQLRGMLGTLGQIQIRVLERARPKPAPTSSTPPASAPSDPDTPPSDSDISTSEANP